MTFSILMTSGSLTSRSLLIVDDSRIRKNAFAHVEKLIKKLDRLERDLESFHDNDQRLFNDWVNLTFRDEQKSEQLIEFLERKIVGYNQKIDVTIGRIGPFCY